MSAKERIIDYADHEEEIKKWIALKGEKKYLRFADILSLKEYPIQWEILKDTYRYDKRLLINIFKYLSFFEEFLRAQVWNLDSILYEKLEKSYLREIMCEVLEHKSEIKYEGFSVDILEQNSTKINILRNMVSHNKIMLKGDKDFCINELIVAFKNTLPESYRSGFVKDINNCTKNLNIPEKLAIKI